LDEPLDSAEFDVIDVVGVFATGLLTVADGTNSPRRPSVRNSMRSTVSRRCASTRARTWTDWSIRSERRSPPNT
jgi:hypothetical protein